MKQAKIKFGVAMDKDLIKKLDNIVNESQYLNVSRSEVVEAIIAAYFKSDARHLEKARELVIMKRKGNI